MDASLGRWADYSTGRPSGAALKAAGFRGVIRYIGLGSASKRITAAEYLGLRAAELGVLLVAESGTGDAWGGYNAGLANARTALNDARALGIPDSVGIAAAADAHATSQAQIDAAVQYARAWRDVLGRERAGFYGFSEVLEAVQRDGSCSWFWQCGGAPGTGAGVHFWQRNTPPTSITVAGVACDVNEQLIEVDSMDWTDVIGHRKDGSPITAGDALANLYLGAYYGGGDAGAKAVFPTVNSLATQVSTLQSGLAAAIGPAVQTAVTNALGADHANEAQQIADDVLAQLSAKLGAASTQGGA